MDGNKITIAILVSTFAFMSILLCLAPSNFAPNDPLNPSNSSSKCWSPPTKEFNKQFLWDMTPLDWQVEFTEIPVHAEFDIYYWYCNTRWELIYNNVGTDDMGWLPTLYLLPGKYFIELVHWQGEEQLCCGYEDEFWIYCREDPVITRTNYITAVKGGDKAFLFFNTTKQSCTFQVKLASTNLNYSLLGERSLGDRN